MLDAAAPPMPPMQGKVTEKKKKKDKNAITKKEAQVKTKEVRAEVDYLKKASKIQSIEIKCLQKALRKEEEAAEGLKVALTLTKEKRKKVEEEVNIEEWVVEAFKSSKALEDIKIAFA
ncbi:hypothetical protein COCNU_scaffold000119G000040 [Cocos nucifera]|nr:hypothetical protein [Cocos nucifera]